MRLNVYSDATPHSVAGIIPDLNISWAQAFREPEEINFAEVVAAINTLIWAAEEVTDTHLILYTDNATALSALRSGRGRIMRFHHIRRLFLSMLHRLRHNTYEVQPIMGVNNPADAPSREVLNTFLAVPFRQQLGLLPDLGNHWYRPNYL